ncbi:MAG: YodL domain-containing protein, partial [Blautia sp.]|uniref:YodL domain-containing protein n=1 Tax=Blautia sp. TaxID=1955243 RepID=UPI002E78928F
MMENNQFVIYRLKNIPENHDIRCRPYEVLQRKHIQIRYENYEKKYKGWLLSADTPDSLRERLNRQVSQRSRGCSIHISDVLVLKRNGKIAAYYAEKERFIIIDRFING